MMLFHNIINRDHKRVARKISKTNKKQLQKHNDLESTTDSTRNRSESKKCGRHEQIQIEKAGERKK